MLWPSGLVERLPASATQNAASEAVYSWGIVSNGPTPSRGTRGGVGALVYPR
jgi:hypothetical protein